MNKSETKGAKFVRFHQPVSFILKILAGANKGDRLEPHSSRSVCVCVCVPSDLKGRSTYVAALK